MREGIFALDRTIWMILEQQGLIVPKSSGDYMSKIFPLGHQTVVSKSK